MKTAEMEAKIDIEPHEISRIRKARWNWYMNAKCILNRKLGNNSLK